MALRQHLLPRLLQRLSQVLGRDLTSRQEADPPPSPVVAAADTKGAPAAYATPESPLRQRRRAELREGCGALRTGPSSGRGLRCQTERVAVPTVRGLSTSPSSAAGDSGAPPIEEQAQGLPSSPAPSQQEYGYHEVLHDSHVRSLSERQTDATSTATSEAPTSGSSLGQPQATASGTQWS